ncbi:MAG: aconitate hydratase AcnA [Rickettsiales bacterium]|jgi:aconitate hydratase|nr:aconitate hydratase AcnA [Rickettsiales bacterium]
MTQNPHIQNLTIGNKNYKFFSLKNFLKSINSDITTLPYSIRILFENYLRSELLRDNIAEAESRIKDYLAKVENVEVAYFPARVLMQDFTGVPAIVDLASMRSALQDNGGDPRDINPIIQVDLVIDHSVQVDFYKTSSALSSNIKKELERNNERYKFLKWGGSAFDNYRAVPPGTGICHQVNLEYLAEVSYVKETALGEFIFPDSLVGTDSHTTMINGIGVFGFGVGGIEAEAAMLGQEVSLVVPKVVGFKLSGEAKEGVTATDIVLTICEKLRKHGVVGKFVEFYGDSVSNLPLADRATIANMSPEFGSTIAYFPVDSETINYMRLTARSEDVITRTESYFKEQQFWRNNNDQISYDEILDFDISAVEPCLAGPKLPQERVSLANVNSDFATKFNVNLEQEYQVGTKDYQMSNGDVVIAAITSCTNTSNPNVMIAAGLIAKKAIEKGLSIKPFVKSSLAPGSQVVTEYLIKAGLMPYLDELGFNVVGYGCTTCIGNSGPLDSEIEQSIKDNQLIVSSVLSGNRNFEGRIHPHVKASYLASPPLVVAYAILGNTRSDITTTPLGKDQDGNDVYLKDLWPSNSEIAEYVAKSINPQMFKSKYANVFDGDEDWQKISFTQSETYEFDQSSTYIQNPPFFNTLDKKVDRDIKDARILALFGDNITTDHISPAGAIAKGSPAAIYLEEEGTSAKDFNSYGSRRGNHEVMMRGTFANIRIKNEMMNGIEGGMTIFRHNGQEREMPIYDAAMGYQALEQDLVIFAGQNYGTGSSRDWAAKGSRLLGVKAVIAESFERIHRSNLIGMGVLPLIFQNDTRLTLKLTGTELVTISGLNDIGVGSKITANIQSSDGKNQTVELTVKIDTDVELKNYQNGGILQRVVREVLQK